MPENVALKFNIGYCQSVKREQNAIFFFFDISFIHSPV